MKTTFTKEEFEKRLKAAPADVLNLILGLEEELLIERLIDKYRLSEEVVGDIAHEIMLVILGFSPLGDLPINLERILNIPSIEAQEVCKTINQDLFSKIRSFVDSKQKKLNDELEEKRSLGLLDKKTSVTNSGILAEIENPTPSIPTGIQISASAASSTLGGFAASAPAGNPAASVASKLDQKLSAPAASAPKEIYQIKKADPYHEPIEL